MKRARLTPAESLWVRHAARIARTWATKGAPMRVVFDDLAHVCVEVCVDNLLLSFALPLRWATPTTGDRLADELGRRLNKRGRQG